MSVMEERMGRQCPLGTKQRVAGFAWLDSQTDERIWPNPIIRVRVVALYTSGK